MNVFQEIGDFAHLLAVFIVLVTLGHTRSCKGISGKTQLLYAVIFTARYVSLFTVFISIYNTAMKITFILSSYVILILMFVFRKSYRKKKDSFWIEILILPLIVLACFFNYSMSPEEIAWAFSVYLEAFAILPQAYYIYKTGTLTKVVRVYIMLLALYKASYGANWIYKYYMHQHLDYLHVYAGSVQVFIYLIYFCIPKSILLRNQESQHWKERNIALVREPPLLTNPCSKRKAQISDVFLVENETSVHNERHKFKTIEDGKY